MSVTSESREITPEILETYLPTENKSTQLVTVKSKESAHSFENERDILYQILFDLRRDVTELKRLVHEQKQYHNNEEPSSISNYTPVLNNLRKEGEDEYVEDVDDVVPIDDIERQTILKALEHHQGKHKEAARELGISEQTLSRKIKDYGLH